MGSESDFVIRRGCLEKWHGIPKERELTEAEQEYVVDVILKWMKKRR